MNFPAANEERVTQPTITVLDALAETLQGIGKANTSNYQVAPAAVLWPDKERLWEAIVPRLRTRRLALLTFGRYAPEEYSGPAYWLRCMIAGTLEPDWLPEGATPIIYLPGVSKQDLRAVEDCPRELQPLAELQYRGIIWTHRNGREWTPAGYLQTTDGGLDIEIAADVATREALQRALPRLVDEPLARLRAAAPLKAEFFDALLAPDAPRSLLLWLDNPAAFRQRSDNNAWAAFVTQAQRTYGINPERDGPISAAGRLGTRQGVWAQVWERFAEAPDAYPNIPDLLRRARPQQLSMFDTQETWPQDNEAAEHTLRERLNALQSMHAAEARAEIGLLEREHAPRRRWIWARLGHSPLAIALAHLHDLATYTVVPLTGTRAELTDSYTGYGWRADAAALSALASVDHSADVGAVSMALRAIYEPWLDQSARAFQAAYINAPSAASREETDLTPGTCLLFCDALRYDLGQRLADAVTQQGLTCNVEAATVPVPGITPTAKPAVSPIANRFTGTGATDLTPLLAERGTRSTTDLLRTELSRAGFQILTGDATGDPTGRAWTELGAIDSYGHQHGWKLAHHVAGELRTIERRIVALLEAGWRQVIVITDHGWLLLPGGLPKVELAEQITTVRKERCARLKPSATTDQRIVPWFWDANVQVAVPSGIACYEAGHEYAHGGLSAQECVAPRLVATRGGGTAAQITRIDWRGLRCAVAVESGAPDMVVDLRTRAADPTTSLLTAPRTLGTGRSAALLVEDEDRMGENALVVVLDQQGAVVSQRATTVGGA
jgi:hypothetical protein